MTEHERQDTPPPRPPLDVRTLVIASLASVIGALVVTRLGYAGKLAGAALAPIVVLLVTEFGHRSSSKLEETAEKVAPVVIRHRRTGPEGTEELPTIRIGPDEPAGAEDLPTVRIDPDPSAATGVRRPPEIAEPPGAPEPEPGPRPAAEPPPTPDAAGETLRIPPSAGPAGVGTGRPYTVHAATRVRPSTRTRLIAVLAAAACGLGISIVALTLLSTASGGHVRLGTAIQNAQTHHKKKAKSPAPASTVTTSGTSSTVTRTTSASTASTTVTTATAPATTASSTSTQTTPASTLTASTATAPATTSQPPPPTTAPAPPASTPPATTPAPGPNVTTGG